MTQTLKAAFITTLLCASLSVPAIAVDKTTTKAEPLTANSTASLKKEFMGKHVDQLPEAESSTKAVDNPDRVVCKKINKTGSRIKKRKVCATKKEWDNLKTETVRAVRQMQLTRGRSD